MIKAGTIFCLLFVFGLYGCKKNEDESVKYPDDYLKSFFSFQTGSFWIYQNDSTLSQDSVFLYFRESIIRGDMKDGKMYNKFQEIHVALKSELYPDSFFLSEIINFGGSASTLLQKWQIYYVYNGNNIYTGEKKNTYGIIYDTLTLNGIKYSNILKVVKTFSLTDLEDSIAIYIARYKGLIKYETYYKDSLPKSFSLVRSNVKIE